MASNDKKSFILYNEHSELINELTDEQAGRLIKGLFQYIVSGEPPELDLTTKMVFISMRQDLDRNAEKYEMFLDKQRQNGLKGGRPRKDTALTENENIEENPKNPTVFSKTQKSLYVNDNDNVNDNVNVNVNVNHLSLSKEEKTEEIAKPKPKNQIGTDEREIIKNYLIRKRIPVRNMNAYISRLVENGDYIEILNEERKEELIEKELAVKKKKQEEKARLKKEKLRIEQEKQIAEKEAEQNRIRDEMLSEETVKTNLKEITDKFSAARILLKYYENGLSPPKEFDEIANQYELHSHKKIEDYLSEFYMNKCRKIVSKERD